MASSTPEPFAGTCSTCKMGLLDVLGATCVLLFRLFGAAVLILVAIFPVYKGMLIGYIPVIAGAVLACLLIEHRSAVIERLGKMDSRLFAVILLALPLVIQVVLIVVVRSEPILDARFVYEEAVVLAQSGVMNPMTYYAPAQTWWYAAFFSIFGASYIVAQCSLLPIVLAISWLSYRLGAYLWGEARGRWAGLVVAYYPGLLCAVLITPYYLYLYTLMILLVATTLVMSLSSRRAELWAITGGVFAGLGALTKAVLLIAPIQALCFWLFTLLRKRPRVTIRLALLFALAMSTVMAPWVLRNAALFGDLVLVNTSGGLVLYSANNPTSNGLYSALPDEVTLAGPREMWEHANWCQKEALAFIRQHPVDFFRLVAVKLIHTWGNESTSAELINFRGRTNAAMDAWFSAMFLCGWAFIAVCWAVRAITQRFERAPYGIIDLLLALIVLSNVLVYCVYEGGARHHVPLVPLIVIYIAGIFAAKPAAPVRGT